MARHCAWSLSFCSFIVSVYIPQLANKLILICFCRQDFLITLKNRDDYTAPGLGVTAVIQYSARDEEEKSTVLDVVIDGCTVEIPVRALVVEFF